MFRVKLRQLASCTGVLLLLGLGSAANATLTTSITLSDPTAGAMPQLCVAGCTGTVTVDPGTPVGAGFAITALNLTITETGDIFGNPAGPNVAFIDAVTGAISGVIISNTVAINNPTAFLNITNTDWNFADLSAGISTGGSSVSVPEPASLALLGIGLIGFGIARGRPNRRAA